MKNFVNISIAFLLTLSLAYGQSHVNSTGANSLNIATPEYAPVDFFKDQKKLFCWSGPFSGATNTTIRNINYMPLMSYNDLSVGQCKIVSYPKAGLSAWEAIIKPIHDLEDQHQEVRKIALDPKIQQKFDIYAFFVEAKNLIPFQDIGDPNAREPKFPCPVYVYKKNSSKWLLLKKVNIKNFDDFADLKFNTVMYNKK